MPKKSIVLKFLGFFDKGGGGLSFSSKYAYNIGHNFGFLPDNPVCAFTPKMPKKSIFRQNAHIFLPQNTSIIKSTFMILLHDCLVFFLNYQTINLFEKVPL